MIKKTNSFALKSVKINNGLFSEEQYLRVLIIYFKEKK